MDIPYYTLNETDSQVMAEGRFWNCQGKHIAVVAVVTKDIDWAAYIGTDAPDSYSEDGTLEYVSKYGCKLSEADAKHIFPDIDLPYRL